MVIVESSGGHGSACFCLYCDWELVVEEAESAEAAAQSFASSGNAMVNQICQRRQGDVIHYDRVTDLISFTNCSLEAIANFLSVLLEAYRDEESLMLDANEEE